MLPVTSYSLRRSSIGKSKPRFQTNTCKIVLILRRINNSSPHRFNTFKLAGVEEELYKQLVIIAVVVGRNGIGDEQLYSIGSGTGECMRGRYLIGSYSVSEIPFFIGF